MILPRLAPNYNYAEQVNQKRLRSQGSPPFNVTCSDISATSKDLFGFDADNTINKFLPLNFIRIVNNGGTDLKVYMNQSSNYEVILNDTIYTNTGNFYSFILENTDSSNAVDGDNVFITVQRKPGV